MMAGLRVFHVPITNAWTMRIYISANDLKTLTFIYFEKLERKCDVRNYKLL